MASRYSSRDTQGPSRGQPGGGGGGGGGRVQGRTHLIVEDPVHTAPYTLPLSQAPAICAYTGVPVRSRAHIRALNAEAPCRDRPVAPVRGV